MISGATETGGSSRPRAHGSETEEARRSPWMRKAVSSESGSSELADTEERRTGGAGGVTGRAGGGGGGGGAGNGCCVGT